MNEELPSWLLFPTERKWRLLIYKIRDLILPPLRLIAEPFPRFAIGET